MADVNEFQENNIYLTDNGFTAGDTGLLYTINDFIINKIGTVAIAHTSAYDYVSTEAAIEACYESSAPNYVGVGLRGRRTRKVRTELDTVGGILHRFISDPANPYELNFWGDTVDEHGYDSGLKTSFLSNLLDIKNILFEYQKIIKNIHFSVEKILANENEKFPDFSVADIYNDIAGSGALLEVLNTNVVIVNNMYDFFNIQAGTHSEFGNNVDALEDALSNILTAIQNRQNSSYFASVMVGVKKWRKFWIKERIFKYSGSLAKLKAMKDAKITLQKEQTVKEGVLEYISSNKDEWIKAPNIYATYYNPIIEEVLIAGTEDEYEYTTKKRISFVRSTYEHTTEYAVFRKTLADAELLGFNNDIGGQWTGTPLSKTHKNEIYDDTENISEEDVVYVYRLQAIDSDTGRINSKSLQSDLLGDVIGNIENGSSLKELKSQEELSGFIFVDGKVNYIEEAIEDTSGDFILKLRYELTSSTGITNLNLLTCVAPNYFIN